MRALVWRENGRLERSDAWPEPALGEHDVLVRVRAAGVCATDLHMVSGRLRFAAPPWVLGHEMAGTVERVGAKAQGWQAGDRVVVDPVVGCGICRWCQSGRKHHCPEGGELGTTRASGGYGEFVAVPAANLYPLPAGLSYAEGAMMEPLNCTLGAIERVRGLAGGRVAVFGAGPAGLLFAQLAKLCGALSVTLVDRREERLQLGLRLGADEAVLAGTGPADDPLARREFEATVEAAGSEATAAACFERVSPGGTVVLYGLHGAGRPNVDTDRIVGKDATVVTCTSAPLLWDKCVRLAAVGRINVRDIVTRRVPFEEAEPVLNELAQGRLDTVKLMIESESELEI